MFEIPHLLRAILARCRRLTQEILLIGLGVLKTTVKLTGRPDLSRDVRTHTSTNCENPRGIQHNQNPSETKLLSVPRMTKISMYSSICANSQKNLCLLEKSMWQQAKTKIKIQLNAGVFNRGSTMVQQEVRQLLFDLKIIVSKKGKYALKNNELFSTKAFIVLPTLQCIK